MKVDLDLKELGGRLKTIDILMMSLLKRRNDLAFQVGMHKMKNGKDFIRHDIEDERIKNVREWAVKHGMNPHYAELMLYSAINESCKLQLEQLQKTSIERLKDPENDDQWYGMLKENLLLLTEHWSKSYDENYDAAYYATRAYLEFEKRLIDEELEKLPHRGLLLDLGCATGRMTFSLADKFDRVAGYDLCPHMIERAMQKLGDMSPPASNVQFFCTDVEAGLPVGDNTASFVMMNFGTASDVRNIGGVIKETKRVLKPGGRFLFSFYNREALVYRWDFIPWPVGLAAEINIHRRCLDVHVDNQALSVFAQPYSREEVEELFRDGITVTNTNTYPTFSSVLPSDLLEDNPATQIALAAIDRGLSSENMGAYIIVTGSKH